MPANIDILSLKERGWTDTLIKNFLGDHDAIESVNHYANFSGKKVYKLTRVKSIEAKDEFVAAFMKSAKRRRLTKKTLKKMLDARR